MTTEESKLEDNVREFLGKHGIEGFFRLYIKEFLVEAFKIAVQSRNTKEEADVAYQYFFDRNGDMRSKSELEAFDERVQAKIDDITRLKLLHDESSGCLKYLVVMDRCASEDNVKRIRNWLGDSDIHPYLVGDND